MDTRRIECPLCAKVSQSSIFQWRLQVYRDGPTITYAADKDINHEEEGVT